MKKILVFSTNWLGDALFLSPLLAGLKYNFPQAHLAVLCVRRVEPMFKNNPLVDEIIIYNEKRGILSLFFGLGVIFKLRRVKFDNAFIIKPSFSRALLLRAGGVKKIIGFDNPKSAKLLDVLVPAPCGLQHKVDCFLTLLEYCGLKIDTRKYVFYTSLPDRVYIKKLLLHKKINPHFPILVLNPGANWVPKRWSPDGFVELIKKIKKSLKLNIIISGAAKDKALVDKIISASGQEVFSFTGETTLGQLAALMQEADIAVSADSGPMHIAAAVGTRVIALFGPTCAKLTGPYPPGEHIIIQKDVGCKIPCYDASCRDYRCMKAICAEDVFEKITALLEL